MPGLSAASAWKNAIKRLGDALFDSLFGSLLGPGGAAGGSGGLIGNFFGSLFGGGGNTGIGLGAGGSGAFVPGTTTIPAFAVGTDYVPRDMLAFIHEGEKITPAKYNVPGGEGRPVVVQNTFHLSGPVDQRTQTQVAAQAGSAVQRALARNR